MASLPEFDEEHNEESIPQFTLLKCLGSGTFGTVWLANWRRPNESPILVALKRIRMEECNYYQEPALVESLNHPNIIRRTL
jgi:serine/threonine protein kinase